MRTHLQSGMLNDVYLQPADNSNVEFGSTVSGSGGAFQIENIWEGGLQVPSPPQLYSPGWTWVSMFDKQPNGGMLSNVANPYYQYEVMVSEVSPLFDSFADTYNYGFIDSWYPYNGTIRINGYYYPGMGGASFKYSLRQGVDGTVVTEKILWIDQL